jgi:Flp pilus assembly protein TadD
MRISLPIPKAGQQSGVTWRWTMRSILLATAAALSLAVAPMAFAAGGADPAPSQQAKPVDPNFARAKAMIEARDYKGAVPLLQQVVAKDSKNADAYNLLGYATRSSGDPNGSLQYYQYALSLDPRHIGAHEYIGEAYLMLGRVQEAEQHLARLDSLCVFGCSEYRMLKTAIANYKAGKRPTN